VARGTRTQVVAVTDACGSRQVLKLLRQDTGPDGLDAADARRVFAYEIALNRQLAMWPDSHVLAAEGVAGSDGAATCLRMPHVDAEATHGMRTLEQVIEWLRKQAPDVATRTRFCGRIARQLAAALRHVQVQHGLVHHDVKPANVVLTGWRGGADVASGTPEVTLIDHGLAKPRGALTMPGDGSEVYMAPEQFVPGPGAQQLSRTPPPYVDTGAVDVWAVGVIVHELLLAQHAGS
jgi:Protein kinase domain